jgi:hypothetical protein
MEITHVLYYEPMKLLRTWEWDEDWPVNDIAGNLFLRFTRQYWMTIQEDRLIGEMPDPDNLEQAMKIWTVPSLLTLLREITCVPSSHGLKGKFQGKAHCSFKDWVDVFFPPPDKRQHKGSMWKELYTRGYIHEYHNRLLEMSDAEAEDLRMHLGDIFENMQCIPCVVPSTATNPGQLWKAADERVLFWANPLHYKIERVAPRTRRGGTVYRIKASRDMINARLDKELDDVDIGDGMRARRRLRNAHKRTLTRQSHAQKNKRVPPARNIKKATEVEASHHVSESELPQPSATKRATRRVVISSEDGCNGGEQDEAIHPVSDSEPQQPTPAKRRARRPVVSSEDDNQGYERDASSHDDVLPSWTVLNQPTSQSSDDDMDGNYDMQDGIVDDDFDMEDGDGDDDCEMDDDADGDDDYEMEDDDTMELD